MTEPCDFAGRPFDVLKYELVRLPGSRPPIEALGQTLEKISGGSEDHGFANAQR